MRVYQLVAYQSEGINGWPFRMRSKRVFVLKRSAARFIFKFRARCTDTDFFDHALDNDTLKIEVKELELTL